MNPVSAKDTSSADPFEHHGGSYAAGEDGKRTLVERTDDPALGTVGAGIQKPEAEPEPAAEAGAEHGAGDTSEQS